MNMVTLEVNGRRVEGKVSPRTHLADFVRDECHLTGTHLGCEHGVCGACTVLVDGQPTRSCITFAVACEGRSIRTIEGYDDDPVMALLRPAFSRHHALQCGYCTPGMLASARDIVLRFPNADETRIRHELAGNLCRCTGYMGIVEAIQDVIAQCNQAAHADVDALRPKRHGGSAARTAPAAFQTFEAEAEAPAAPSAENAPTASERTTDDGTHIKGHFKVSHEPDAVWGFMADLPAVAACLPGAELTEHEGDRVKGRVAIKFGPMAASFVGSARLERDDAQRHATLKGAGQDSLSQSRATGDVNYRLSPAPNGGTRVDVDLLYSLQGPLAQFSRSGLVKDFVSRLIQEFGKNVERRMDPNRAPGEALPPAQLNAFSLGLSVLWARIKRLFGIN